jgi:dihydrofolate reductase
MGNLSVFNSVSLDGYFVDANGDMSWAIPEVQDEEWLSLVSANARSGAMLVFGRITYEMMAAYWTTQTAMQNDPLVAEGMRRARKIVFSRTLQQGSWDNTRLVRENLAPVLHELKQDHDLVLLGSGSLVLQLTRKRLVDEYTLVVAPVVLGGGRTMFEGIEALQRLKLVEARPFKNGNVVLKYQPHPRPEQP